MKPEQVIIHPDRGVGSINFGDDIKKHAEKLNLKLVKSTVTDKDYWFESEELGLSVYDDDPEEPGIDTIHCEEFLFLNGQNLIGMHINDFARFVQAQPDLAATDFIELPDGTRQFVHEFDSLGLQVWVNEEDKLVDTIIVGRIYDDED